MNKLLVIKKYITPVAITILSIVGHGYLAFAVAPTGGYNPAQTLDPACAPGDADCFVKSISANNGLTLTGTNMQLGGALVADTDIAQGTNTLTSTFNGTNGSFGFVNGNYGPIQATGMFYIPTATPYIITGSLVSETGANLATRNYITTEQSQVGAWIDSGTGEHRASITARASDASNMYAFTSFARGSAIMSEYNESDDFSYKSIRIDNSEITQFLNYSRTDNQNYLYNEMKMDDSSLHFSIGNSVVAGVFSGSGKEYELSNTGHEFKGLDLFANQYPNARDDSGVSSPLNFLYTDSNGKILSAPTSLLGGSGWSLTGNTGTDGGLTNFIGTTDAQDFVVKINTLETARFGQDGNVSLGLASFATGGDSSFAQGSATASGKSAIAMGYDGTTASGGGAVAIGHSLISSGNFATAFGTDNFSRSYAEFTSGLFSTDYVPQSTSGYDALDRLFTIGNGNSIAHNAYTLWKDGSFAYNDDNFQNDAVGTEQNMFYFNYGNHDGLGTAQTKRAIRLGSAMNDEWDINSSNVGDRSIAIGFGLDTGGPVFNGPQASGFGSMAIGFSTKATNQGATAMGLLSIASGSGSFAVGTNGTNNTTASGESSLALGRSVLARSFSENALGSYNTDYSPVGIIASDPSSFDGSDRILSVGNGTDNATRSDAFTILKDGRTAVAVDNFEANALPLATSVFQVGDGTTGIIGYVDSGTGNWVAVSDERKKHGIADISYGLSDILKLRPVSFNYNRNNEHTIGFLAQQVLPIIPESVYGTEQDGYGMSYQTLVPVTVKAIQELNLKLSSIESVSDTLNPTFIQNMRNWFAGATNGITLIISDTLKARNQICIDDVCMTKDQLRTIIQNSGSAPVSGPAVPPSDPVPPATDPETPPADPETPPSDPVIPVTDPAPEPAPAPAPEPVPSLEPTPQ